jgi:hypothetical protein
VKTLKWNSRFYPKGAGGILGHQPNWSTYSRKHPSHLTPERRDYLKKMISPQKHSHNNRFSLFPERSARTTEGKNNSDSMIALILISLCKILSSRMPIKIKNNAKANNNKNAKRKIWDLQIHTILKDRI